MKNEQGNSLTLNINVHDNLIVTHYRKNGDLLGFTLCQEPSEEFDAF